MKKLLFFAALAIASCQKESEHIGVTDVKLDEQTYTLVVGKSLTLTATVFPEEATDKTVAWTSDNEAAATVENGLVTALKDGEATITATTKDGGMTATCVVTVVTAAVDVTGVELSWEVYRLPVGDRRPFTATVLPAEATDKAVTWESDDETVATVENGLVTALKEGDATITVTTRDGKKSDLCTVTVIEAAIDCTTDAPGWGESLGEVGFRSDRTWTVGTQTWSDVVVASRCGKETFDSGAYPTYKADCRDNYDADRGVDYGHLFSWAAVYRFQSELCPDGWRVPVKADYTALDLEFGGTGESRSGQNEFAAATYLDPDVWGGARSGYCGSNGYTIHREEYCGYWTQSQNQRYANHFEISTEGYLSPPTIGMKYIGFPLRCVK